MDLGHFKDIGSLIFYGHPLVPQILWFFSFLKISATIFRNSAQFLSLNTKTRKKSEKNLLHTLYLKHTMCVINIMYILCNTCRKKEKQQTQVYFGVLSNKATCSWFILDYLIKKQLLRGLLLYYYFYFRLRTHCINWREFKW